MNELKHGSPVEEKRKPFNFSRRRLLGLFLGASANQVAKRFDWLPGAKVAEAGEEEVVQTLSSQENENSFPYAIENFGVDKQTGFYEVTFSNFDQRILRGSEEENDYRAHQFSPLGTYNFRQVLEQISHAMHGELENLFETYDEVVICPVQLFSTGEDKEYNSIAVSFRAENIMGGIVNFNIGNYYQAIGEIDPFDHAAYIFFHEIQHNHYMTFPRAVTNDDGITFTFSHDSIHLNEPRQPIQGSVNKSRIVHPHMSSIGVNETLRVALSPIELFFMGLLTASEFEDYFDGGRPFVERHLYDSEGKILKVEKIYYSTQNLTDTFSDQDVTNMRGSIDDFRNNLLGLKPFEPGFNLKADGSPHKIAVLPMIFRTPESLQEDANFGDELTYQENVVIYQELCNQFAHFLDKYGLGKIDASVITSNTAQHPLVES